MKARYTKTGEEITILGISKEWGTATYIKDGILYQDNLSSGEWEIIDESEPVDWSSFRRESAKDILCAMLGRVERFYTGVSIDGKNKISDHKDFIKLAIKDADELIKQLKQE